jgi:hypothetical protein
MPIIDERLIAHSVVRSRLWTMVFCFAIFPALRSADGEVTTPAANGTSAQVIFEVQLPDPAFELAPSRQHRIVQFRDTHDFPTGYALAFSTEVCTDEQCRLVEVTMYWNAVGRYDRLECLPGKPLTKKKHVPFLDEDYIRLDEILKDRNSILANHPVTFFAKPVDPPQAVDDHQGIDAITSATPLTVQQAVVKDAAYTTWVMWQWANGPLAERLVGFTAKSCTPAYLKHLLQSEDRSCVDFALGYVQELHASDEQYVDNVLGLLESGDRDLITRALQFLDGAANDTEQLHTRLIEACCHMKETYSPIVIRYLTRQDDLPRSTLEKLTDHLNQLPYFQIHLILRLLEQRAFFSSRTESNIVQLLDGEDFFIARRACEHLLKQTLSSEASARVHEFRERNQDRL